MADDNLIELRRQISLVDNILLRVLFCRQERLLEKTDEIFGCLAEGRIAIALEIEKRKRSLGLPIYNEERERDEIERLLEKAKTFNPPVAASTVEMFFPEQIRESREAQEAQREKATG